MGYDIINEFVKKEDKPYEYCLEFEYSNSNYMTLDPIERYLTYKSTGVKVDKNKQSYSNTEHFCLNSKDTYGNIPDCDGSDGRNLLALDIYKKLWNWEKDYYSFGEISAPNFKGEFGGDTMNSMQITFNTVMKHTLAKPENNMLGQYRKNNYSFMDCLQVYCDYPEKLISELHKEPEFIQFVNLYHTIGNMVLVPRRFNSGRYGRTFDFWDSSLVWLKKDGFVYGENQIFDKRDFIKYINYFYLWDYVECVNGEYKVKPLFDSHRNIENGSINYTQPWTNLNTESDLKQFLNNACEKIKRRGVFMTILMRLKSTDNPELIKASEELFSFIQSNKFLNSAHKDGYSLVAGKLLDLLGEVQNKDNGEFRTINDEVSSLIVFDADRKGEKVAKRTFSSKLKSKIQEKIDEKRSDLRQTPIETIADLTFSFVSLVGIVAAITVYIRYLIMGGYSREGLGLVSNPLNDISSNYLIIPSLVLLVLGFLLLCMSYIKKHHKFTKVLMIISLIFCIILCIIPPIFVLLVNVLNNNEEFLLWFYSSYAENANVVNNGIKIFAVVILVCLPIPTILMLIDSYYRKYVAHSAKTICLWILIIPFILALLSNKYLAIIILMGLIGVMFMGLKKTCPSCRKFNALKSTGREIISKEDIAVLEDVETRNEVGDVIQTSQQYVPGVRVTYDKIYVCSNCGYEKRKRRVEDIKKISRK